MSRQNQGLTWHFKLRATSEEEAIVRGIVEAHAECGVTISLNEAVRLLIRRGRAGATPGPECRPGGAALPPVKEPAPSPAPPVRATLPLPSLPVSTMPFGVYAPPRS